VSGSRFNFSLRRLLSIRENAERVAAVDLAMAHAVEENARQVQESLDEERAQARDALLPPPGQESRVSELQQVAFLIEQLDTHGETARESVAEAERTVEEKRVRLGETLRDRRVLDRLQEREREEWNIAEKREDRSEMDEIARGRHSDGKASNPKAGE
jgi:flagellar export protein FliJ